MNPLLSFLRAGADRLRILVTLATLFVAALSATAPAHAQAIGPDPTAATLEAARGPFAFQRATIATGRGFRRGTVFFPTNAGNALATIAVSPGFTATQSSINWLGPRLASWGFVVITIDTNSTRDQPAQRATQLRAALQHVVEDSRVASSPFFGKVDPNRLGVMGHSMGGGGALVAAAGDARLKAAIPLAPWNLRERGQFDEITVPTLVIACQRDTVARVSEHASRFFESIPATTDKAFMEVRNGSHLCPTTSSTANQPIIGKYSVAWMKRFMDNDTRFSPFLCDAPHQADLAGTRISAYRENCPY